MPPIVRQNSVFNFVADWRSEFETPIGQSHDETIVGFRTDRSAQVFVRRQTSIQHARTESRATEDAGSIPFLDADFLCRYSS
jgi:hypothetical protein